MKASQAEINFIIPREHRHAWYDLKPDIFYKDGLAFGLIKLVPNNGLPIVNSISLDNQHYTVGMIKHILKYISQYKQIVVMSTVKDSPALNRLMDRYVEKGIESYFVKGL